MNNMRENAAISAKDVIRRSAHPLSFNKTTDYKPLMEFIGDARFVLLGEASHGTHEFYDARAQITKRLIEEKGFNAVALGRRSRTQKSSSGAAEQRRKSFSLD